MNTAYLSLGANQGDKFDTLQIAIRKLNSLGDVTQISSVYQTPPWGFESDDFYNIVICLQTPLDASILLPFLLDIETELGRKRDPNKKGYAARPLDIDVIFFNNEVINTKTLIVPHPRAQDRKFVLVPLKELAPDYKHPILKKSVTNLLNTTIDKSEISLVTHLKLKKK